MLVLITYDINTETAEGRSRLRRIAKECVNYGQRVQNSVFECCVAPLDFRKLKDNLEKIADKEKDSIRYYFLGKKWENRIEHYGKDEVYNPEGPLII